MRGKGQAYAGPKDALGNFKREGERSGISKYTALRVYAHKHEDAIDAFCREEYTDTEPIHLRIADAINYLFILYAMYLEDVREGIHPLPTSGHRGADPPGAQEPSVPGAAGA